MSLPNIVAHIEQVISAPYPATLMNIALTLSTCSIADITSWATLKPCQIQPLLQVLASRIDSDELAFDVLTTMLTPLPVFHSFVQTCPSLLEQLYGRHLGFMKTMLSGDSQRPEQPRRQLLPTTSPLHVLPGGASIPASYYSAVELSLQGFDDETLDKWQFRVYIFLADAPLDVLCCLGEGVIQICVQRWATLMRSSNCVESLYAAYLASRLQRHHMSITNPDSSLGSCPSVCPTLRAWIEKCNAIFRGTQVTETVKNTLVRVLKLCCDEKARSLVNSDRAVILAHHVLNVALVHYGSEWNKDTAPYARKLSQKFTSMPPSLQAASIHVLALADVKVWAPDAPEILQVVLQHMSNVADFKSDLDFDPKTADMMVRVVSRCVDLGGLGHVSTAFATFFRDVFTFVSEQCQPQQSATPAKCLLVRRATDLVQALQPHSHGASLAISELILQSVRSTGLPEWWTLNMSTPGSPENCYGLQSCVHNDESRRQALCDNVSMLIVTCACLCSSSLDQAVVDLVNQRLRLQRNLEEPARCIYRPFVVAHQLVSMPTTEHISSHNWRHELQKTFSKSTADASQLVEQVIIQITRDLQNRCDNAEAPLREAHHESRQLQETVQRLEGRLSSAHAEIASLQETLLEEREARNRDITASQSLEMSILELRQELEDAHRQIEKMKTECGVADAQHKETLQELKQKNEEQLDQVQRQACHKIADLEAQLSSQVQAASALETESAWLKEQMELAKKEMEAAHARQLDEARQYHLDEETHLNQQLENLQSTVKHTEVEMQRLTSEVAARDESLKDLNRENGAIKEQVSNLQSELQAAISSNDTLSAELDVAKEDATHLTTGINNKDRELAEHGERIDELEKGNERWRQRCAALENALAEAKKREQGIQALLASGGGGNFNGGGLSGRDGLNGRRTTIGAIRNTQRYASTPMAAPRLPAGSFMSEDDEDYLEIMKLGQ